MRHLKKNDQKTYQRLTMKERWGTITPFETEELNGLREQYNIVPKRRQKEGNGDIGIHGPDPTVTVRVWQFSCPLSSLKSVFDETLD